MMWVWCPPRLRRNFHILRLKRNGRKEVLFAVKQFKREISLSLPGFEPRTPAWQSTALNMSLKSWVNPTARLLGMALSLHSSPFYFWEPPINGSYRHTMEYSPLPLSLSIVRLFFFFFTKIYFKSLPKKEYSWNYNLARGTPSLKIQYCDCLHDSRDSRGRPFGISTYRNGPNCAKNTKFFSFKLGIYWGKLGNKEDILDWEWGQYGTLVIGRKCPASCIIWAVPLCPCFLFL